MYPAFQTQQIEEMALESIELDAGRFLRHTERMLRMSIDAEQFLVEAITGAAVVLGDWWASDRLNYRSVELGSERLLELVYDIADERLRLPEAGAVADAAIAGVPVLDRRYILETLTGEAYLAEGRPGEEGILLHGVYHRPRGWGYCSCPKSHGSLQRKNRRSAGQFGQLARALQPVVGLSGRL